MRFFLAESYGYGLKTRLRQKNKQLFFLHKVNIYTYSATCADVYFAGDEGLEKLRSLVDEFQLQVCSIRWPSLILTSILQIIATRGIDVHEILVGTTL